jgi:hypothetical protein
METRKLAKLFLYLFLCSTVVFALAFLGGCKGDDGANGAPGAPGADATFANSDCIDCHHLNSLTLNPTGEIFLDGLAGADKSVATGATTTIGAVLSKLPAGEVAASYVWSRTDGLGAALATATTRSVTVIMPAAPNYKNALIAASTVPDRTTVFPVSNLALEQAGAAELKLLVFTVSGKAYWDQVLVTDSAAAAALSPIAKVNPGINNVPSNEPVLLVSKASVTGYNWSLTANPGGVTLQDATTQYPYFTPTTAGLYTLNESNSGVNVNIYAGTWRGEIIGQVNNVVTPDPACTGCHNSATYTGATNAPDKFTPWKASGHAQIFSQNLNAGGHYGPSCFPCHTVGFNLSATNNGFDEQTGYVSFSTNTTFYFNANTNNARYAQMWTDFPALAAETNIQCENCHGPQNSNGHATVAVPGGSTLPSPRTSMAADVCGSCHGEPMRHGRFQQWQESGHGQYDVAIGEGVASNGTGTLANTGCAGCHSAQGFLVYLKQLQSGLDSRTIPAFPLTSQTVHPVTCQVCHDPHAEGTTSGEPNNTTVRVMDNTPKLPGGFTATGVGRGAICIVCHNSRNGEKVTGAGNATLHQDGDPNWGSLTTYSGPHEACQGDVLMGYNAYFVGNGIYRSPHSLIVDTCTNCHMEQTPPPPLLSYALGGSNHNFEASINVCVNCHSTNEALGPMLQATVKSELELLQDSISTAIVTRNTVTDFRGNGTGCIITGVADLGSRGSVHVTIGNLATATTCTAGPSEAFSASLGSMLGIRICTAAITTDCLATDDLAKALWNFYLIEQDVSLGVHNPDFTFQVIGQSKFKADRVKEP